MLYIIVVVLYFRSYLIIFLKNFNVYCNYAEPQMHPKCVLIQLTILFTRQNI